MISWLKAHAPTQRRLIQLYAALLYNAHAKGYITGNIYTGKIKTLCVPGLNCYSCPGAVGACPLGALQNALASSGSRAPTYMLGILLLFGLIFGRTICGFLCPFGLIQDLLHKLPTPKLPKSRLTRALSKLKYVLLIVFVCMIPLWYAVKSLPLPAFCKYICPAGTLEGAVGLLSNPANADKYSMLGPLFTGKFLILLLVIGLCVFIYRAFCRFLCPLGAIYGLFARVAVIGVKVAPTGCTNCGQCLRHCPMDIRRVGDHECIHCGKCIAACPEKVISYKMGRVTLAGKRKTRTLAWLIALLALVSVLFLVNPPAPKVDPPPFVIDEGLPVGKEVGMRAPDFTVPMYGQDAPFTLSDHLGKTVVVNFWATWCTPCVKELPYFDDVYRAQGDSVAVVAIHSSLVTDNVEKYLAQFDYALPFALDETGGVITSFGGSTMLPHTVIIDKNGVITYNATGSLTPEKLNDLLSDL